MSMAAVCHSLTVVTVLCVADVCLTALRRRPQFVVESVGVFGCFVSAVSSVAT